LRASNVNLCGSGPWDAQAPPFAHLNAICLDFDMKNALRYVKDYAGLSDRVMEQWGKR